MGTTVAQMIPMETLMVPISLHDLVQSPLYTEGKFWVAAAGFMWALSQASNRVMNWFRDVREGVLAKMQNSIDQMSTDMTYQTSQMRADAKEHTASIITGFKDQTAAMVSEMREQRADFRMLIPLAASSTKPRRKPAKLVANAKTKRKPLKEKAKAK